MKLLLSFLIVCSLASCTTTLFQVQTVSSKNVKTNSNEKYVYSDSLVSIKYNLWSKGGTLSFTIRNKTDSLLYFDWNKSYLLYKGYRYNYYRAATYNSPDSVATYKEPSADAGMATYLKQSKPRMELEGNNTMLVRRFNLNGESTLEFDTKFGRNEENTETFTDKNTPLSFKNHLVISTKPDTSTPHIINNTFWVSSTRNFTKKEFHDIEIPTPNSFYATKRVFDKGSTIRGAVIVVGVIASIFAGYYFPFFL